jgi:hypothetical protein
VPIYTCPRCGGKDGYTKRTHELRADGLKRTTVMSWEKTQKLKNVDLVITACRSCGEEMEEQFTPAEIEQKNQITVEQTIESMKVGKRVYRIIGYVLISLSAYIFIIFGLDVIADGRTDFILPGMFWTLAFGISGILLIRKYRKSLVSVWIISPGKTTNEYRTLLAEFAKNEKQLSSMIGFIETNTPFNASGLINPEEASQFGERLGRLGAKVLIG